MKNNYKYQIFLIQNFLNIKFLKLKHQIGKRKEIKMFKRAPASGPGRLPILTPPHWGPPCSLQPGKEGAHPWALMGPEAPPHHSPPLDTLPFQLAWCEETVNPTTPHPPSLFARTLLPRAQRQGGWMGQPPWPSLANPVFGFISRPWPCGD